LLAQGGIQQTHDLVHGAGGGDELQKTQVIPFRYAVDQIGLVEPWQVAGRVEVLDTGMTIHGHYPVA
jgi:hypothetical protein